MAFADKYIAKKKQIAEKTTPGLPIVKKLKEETKKVGQKAAAAKTAARQEQAAQRVQSFQAAAKGSTSQKSSAASQKSGSSGGAKATAVSAMTPLQRMQKNSEEWAQLNNRLTLPGLDISLPENAALKSRMDVLARANEKLGAGLGLTRDSAGFWRTSAASTVLPQSNKLPDLLRSGASSGQLARAGTTDDLAFVPRVLPVSGVSQLGSGSSVAALTQAAEWPEKQKTVGELLAQDAKDFAQGAKDTAGAVKDAALAAGKKTLSLGRSALSGLEGGLHQFNQGVYSTLDAVVPDWVPGLSDFIKFGKQTAAEGADRIRQENYARGGAEGIVGDVSASLVASLPSAVAALLSGGSSLSAQLGSRAGAVTSAAQQLLQNPATWTNAMQTYGPEYEKAKQSGASDMQAAATALTSTLLQAGIEVSGGMETLGKTAKGLGGYVKSALEEGVEEVAQDLASRSAAALTYDRPQALEDIYSKENPEALINPVRMAQQAAMGAAVGGLYSGAHAIGSRIGQRAGDTKSRTAEQVLPASPQLPDALTDTVPTSRRQNTAGDMDLPLPQTANGGTLAPDAAGQTRTSPGLLRQGTWAEGEVKPRLRPEYEERPVSSYRTPEEEAMLQAQLAAVEEPDGFEAPEVQTHTAINTDPGTRTPEQMAQIQEYVDAADDGLLDFVERYAEDPNAQFGRYTISKVSRRQADDISGILGIDASGYQNAINKNGVNHILKRHGANGEADRSMAELSDISRMGYVLDTYDSVQPLTDEKGSFVTSTEFRGKENAPAPMVRFAKKIDGTYYVVEAVADNRYKKLWVVSAYMDKSSPITQVLDAERTAPSSQSSGTPLASLESALNQSIPYKTAENKIADSGHTQTQRDTVRMAENAALAQGQLEALASDTMPDNEKTAAQGAARSIRYSYEAPDIIAQEEAAVRAAENAALAQGQLEALGSDSYEAADIERQQERQNRAARVRQGDVDAIRAAWDDARQMKRRTQQAEQRMHLTDRDKAFVESALRTGSTTNFYEADNPQDVQYLYELRAAERDALAPVWEYNAKQQEQVQLDAAEDADMLAEFAKDKKRGLYYLTETPERNVYDIFGKKNRDKADKLIGRYIAPVHKAVAEGNRLKQSMRGQIKALGLDKHESAVVQYLLENQAGGAAQYIREHKVKMTDAKQAKIDKAVRVFRQVYNELFDQINQAQIRNGYEPTEYRKNYAPHFVEKQEDKLLARVLYKLGMKITKKDQLPTDLAGVTETFRPGRRWFGNLERRQGSKTTYDAVQGFDRYIETAADVITLTDSIGRIRTLEDAVRYRLSDEGTQARIDAIRTDRSLDALKRRQAMEQAYEDEPGKVEQIIRNLNEQKEMGMRNFVTELRRYGDSLAGKKSRGDRGIEDMIGRDIYEISRAVEGRVAANMIGANPGSWLTNFIPLTQAMGEVDTASMLKGLYQTVKAYAKDDGFADASAFLTNRRGSDSIARDKLRTVSDALGKPMEWIDQFVADTVVRARTAQNMDQNGMNLEAAIDEADAFAASLMGDRSKGSMPGVFEMRNPVTKVFTMYQLEVNNQLRYLAKDLPRRLGEEGAAAVALGLTKVFAGAYLYNALYRELTGRDAALDPIRMVQEALGGIGDEEDERTAAERAGGLLTDLGGNVPFVGGVFFDGGRVPVSSALPNMANLLMAAADRSKAPEKRWDMAKKELLKPAAYILPPFGGGAVKRAVEGYQTVSQGGAYGLNNEGERELMFPQYGQGPADYAKAMLFGRWSTEQAQEYVDSGFSRLNAEDTAAYEHLVSERGFTPQQAYEAITAINKVQAPEDKSLTTKQAKRQAIMSMDIDWEDKVELDRLLVGGDDLVSYLDEDSFRLTNELPENEQTAAFRLMRDYGLNAEQAMEYAGFYGEMDTYTLNENKTITKTYADGTQVEAPLYEKDSKQIRLQKALDTIAAATDLTDAQKDGIMRTALLPELGEKYVQSYADAYIEGIGTRTLFDAKAAYERISEEVKSDITIHEKNRSEFIRLRFDDYLESTGLSRAQQDKLWYFQAHGSEDLTSTWQDIIRSGGEDVQAVGAKIAETGMDAATYKAIKAGMDRIYSDKDANGKTIADTKKPKIIAYLNEYPELTDEQKDLLMRADGYKYGMGDKPGKRSSKKGSSGSGGSSSKRTNPLSSFPTISISLPMP